VTAPADESDPRSRRLYAAALLGVAAAVLVLFVRAGSAAFFEADDWLFLTEAGRHGIDPIEALLPGRRSHWAYRPLGVDVFFQTLHRLFGLEIRAYVAAAALAIGVRGLALAGVLRSLGVPASLAAAAALWSATRWPSFESALWPSAYQYLGASALGVVALHAYLCHVRTGGRAAYGAALGAFGLALLHNESALAAAGVLALAGLWIDPPRRQAAWWRRTALRLAPVALVGLAYLWLRFVGLERVETPPYVSGEWTLRLARRITTGNLRLALEGVPLAAGLGAAALLLAAAARPAWRRPALGLAALAGLWLALAALPYTILLAPQARHAVALEAPLALALAAAALPAWRRTGPRLRRAVAVGVVAACVPWGAMRDRIDEPRGETSRVLAVQLRALAPRPGERLFLLWGAPGLAGPADYRRIHRISWGGWMTAPLFPERDVRVMFVDLRSRPPPGACHPCRYLELRPDATLVPTTAPRPSGVDRGAAPAHLRPAREPPRPAPGERPPVSE